MVLDVRDALIKHAPMIDFAYHVISVYALFSVNDRFKPLDRHC